MTVWSRVAVVAAVVFLLGAVAATFLPASPQGATCGSWVAPEYSDDRTAGLMNKVEGLIQDAEADPSGGLSAEAYGIRDRLVTAKRLCDDALGTRRTITLVLLGALVVVPAGLLFVGGGAARRE